MTTSQMHPWSRLTREETDRQYNPTLWTRRLPTDDLLPTHIEWTTRSSQDYREKIGAGRSTLAFGEGGFAGEIDVFRGDAAPDDAPIVFYVHGGWWQWFSKEQFSFLAEPFNRKQMAVYMPGYRMAQDWNNGRPIESIVEQMRHALAATLRDAEAKDAPAVYLIGHSAGGHIVSMLRGMDPQAYGLPEQAMQRVRAVFSLAGLFDLRYLLDSFVNDEIGMTLESAEAMSPLLAEPKVGAGLCPIHLVVPEHDTAEFFRQTKEYHNKLLEEGQLAHLQVAYNRDHLDIIERFVDEDDVLLNDLLEQMSPGTG